ncbi:MAG: hypothetical protein AAGI01_09555 [Myxococcota bacterium]
MDELRSVGIWTKVVLASACIFLMRLWSFDPEPLFYGGCASNLTSVGLILWLLQLWILLTTLSALGHALPSVVVVAVNSELFYSQAGARHAMVKVALSAALLSGLAALGVLIVHLFLADEVPDALTLKDAVGTFVLALPAQAWSLHYVLEQERRRHED